MRKTTMKNSAKVAALTLALGLVLTGCGNVFHNGTNMVIDKIKIVGLPSQYSGKQMIFTFEGGGGGGKWVHDVPAVFTASTYKATVSGTGSWTLDLVPDLTYTGATIKFLLIDDGKNWDVLKVDKKHSAKNGGDVILDNQWNGPTPLTISGTVKGDDVDWVFQ